MNVKKRYRRERKREGRGMYLLPLLFFFCMIPFYMSGYSEREKETLILDSTPGQVWIMQKRIWGNYKEAMVHTIYYMKITKDMKILSENITHLL